jgi:hypothetical protein
MSLSSVKPEWASTVCHSVRRVTVHEDRDGTLLELSWATPPFARPHEPDRNSALRQPPPAGGWWRGTRRSLARVANRRPHTGQRWPCPVARLESDPLPAHAISSERTVPPRPELS